jgi:predicted transcriptional regulator
VIYRTPIYLCYFRNTVVTKLEMFLKRKGIKPLHLATKSGYTRQWLVKIRMGRVKATERCVNAIVAACAELSGEKVTASDLFDARDRRNAKANAENSSHMR